MITRYPFKTFRGALMVGIACSAFMLTTNNAQAQPANDECANAIMIPFDADSASCSNTAGTSLNATQSADPTDVCSGSWFDDDVWFSFTTPATLPPSAITVRTAFNDSLNPGDIVNVGMGLYAGCGAGELAMACFSGANDRLTLPATDFTASTTYYVRVWSDNNSTPMGGSFTICAFADNNFSTACSAGTITTPGPLDICPNDMGTIIITGEQVPTGGGFGYTFTEGPNAGGGLAGGFTLTGAVTNYTFDNDLNGVMSGNMLGLLTGTWFISPVVYTDAANATTSICDTLPTSVQVNFLPASDPLCGGSSVAEIDRLNAITISPNPTVGQLTINSSLLTSLDVITVYDLTGRNVHEGTNVNFMDRQIQVDLSTQPNGVYLIGLQTAGEVLMKRIVLQR